jgi:hypothetical protein
MPPAIDAVSWAEVQAQFHDALSDRRMIPKIAFFDLPHSLHDARLNIPVFNAFQPDLEWPPAADKLVRG